MFLGQEAGRSGKRLRAAAVVFLAVAVLDAALYLFLVSPSAEQLEASRAGYANLKKQYADAVLYQSRRQAFAGLKKGALFQKDVPLIINEVVKTAKVLGLSVESINSDIPQASGGLIPVTFTVPVSGAYQDIKRFIFAVETSERLIGIDDLKFSADKGRVKLQMKIVTYIRG